MLDLSNLEKALNSLKVALDRSKTSPQDEELRDACIQRFEYSFELAWKLIKRQLELEIGNSSEVDSYSKKTLFRVAGEKGLIVNIESWFDFITKRNLTSHTYNANNAILVYGITSKFYNEASELLRVLKTRHD